MTRYGFLCLFLFSVLSVAQAATDDFTVSTIIEDNDPPSTPSIISVDPVSHSRIDVVWSTSTDNLRVGGYRLFRDGSQIATTTLTSFSDTGLSPSTTYSYTVNAFDTTGNTSTTSAPVATTTLEAPPPPPLATTTSAGPVTSSYGRVTLENIAIEPDHRSTLFRFESKFPSGYSLRWGRTSAYDGGFIISDVFRRKHETLITDLEPDTIYEYELVGYDGAGRPWPLKEGTFRTTAPPDEEPPLNVTGLTATVEGGDVVLSWSSPRTSDFSHVRVMRSYLFYPTDPNDGFFRYQGGSETFRDQNAFVEHDTQFYTIFAYDRNGNTSSGAVVYARKPSTPTDPAPTGASTPLPDAEEPTGEAPPPFPEPTDEAPVPAEYELLEARDVSLIQNGETYRLSESGISLFAADNVTVRVPYEAVPEHLKSIVVDIASPESETAAQSYLLRINNDSTAYEAVLPGFAVAGESATVVVQVFDHLFRRAHAVSGRVTLLPGSGEREASSTVLFPDRILPTQAELLTFLGLMVAAGVLFLLWRRRKRKEEKQRPLRVE